MEVTSASWTIASYVITAGAFIIAMIAILKALKDRKSSGFQSRRRAMTLTYENIATFGCGDSQDETSMIATL